MADTDLVLTKYVREPNSFTLDFYLAARGLRGAEDGADQEAGRDHRDGEGVGPARPRRRRFSDRHEVAVRRQENRTPLHRLQRRRERAGDVQGPPADGAQPAPAHRGVRDWLLRDRREGRLHLHSRRVLPRAGESRARHRRGLREGHSRQEHFRIRLRLRRVRPPRRRRLRGGRGDGAARVARGQARAAAQQAAVSRRGRRLRQADRGQQRRDAVQRARHHLERRRLVLGSRPREERRPEAVLRQRSRSQTRRLRSVDERDAARVDRRATPAACARGGR